MVYDCLQIRKDVRVALDMNDKSKALINLGDMDTLQVDSIIDSVVEDAARRVVEAAPVDMLESGHNFAEDLYWSDDEERKGCGWTILPDDFLRLVLFKMSDWKRSVSYAITDTDPSYDLQSSQWKGVRGNVDRPVCAIVRRAEGKVLEYYSCDSEDAYAEQAVYQPVPRISGGGLDLPRLCYRGVVYYAAGLTALSLRDSDTASAFFSMAMRAINIKTETS